MSALRAADRLVTIAVTAALTSAGWLIYGNSEIHHKDDLPQASSAPSGVSRSLPTAAAPAAATLPEAETALTIPVTGVKADQLVDSFADSRAAGERAHQAIDIMAEAGTPVVAAAPGTVESLFVSHEGGNTIYVRSPDRRTIYYYAHLQSYSPGLKEGQLVGRGQRLGLVGSSGNADAEAPHLHFAIMRTSPQARWWDAGQYEDPFPLLGGRSRR